MDELIKALAPGFVAGFAVQRMLQIFDWPIEWLAAESALSNWFFKVRVRPAQKTSDEDRIAKRKTLIAALVSLIVGVGLALFANVRVLAPIGADAPEWMDILVTGLVVSAGTEGMNSILKWLGYKKDDAKESSDEDKGQAAEATEQLEVAHTTRVLAEWATKDPEALERYPELIPAIVHLLPESVAAERSGNGHRQSR